MQNISEVLCPFLKEKGICVESEVDGTYDCVLFNTVHCALTNEESPEVVENSTPQGDFFNLIGKAFPIEEA